MKTLVGGESHVVGVQCVRDDEVRFAVIHNPVG
jgi:hypothetical protein